MRCPVLMVIAAGLIVSCGPASARIGETFEQCKARYGEPVITNALTGAFTFLKNGMFVSPTFYEGKCDSILFMKAGKDADGDRLPLSGTEIEILLQANAGNIEWAPTVFKDSVQRKTSKDGSITARYHEREGALDIETSAHAERLVAGIEAKLDAEQKSEEQKLKDF